MWKVFARENTVSAGKEMTVLADMEPVKKTETDNCKQKIAIGNRLKQKTDIGNQQEKTVLADKVQVVLADIERAKKA